MTETLKLPVLPLSDSVVLPGMVVPLRLDEAEIQSAVDAAVAAAAAVVIGSGIRGSKLALPGELAARLPGAEVIEGLAR